uniref:Uncharacterized protein n=1 Tax=Rhizophora mucronata TaxID=61149 RepID=A0A2P2N2T2_RHIMU
MYYYVMIFFIKYGYFHDKNNFNLVKFIKKKEKITIKLGSLLVLESNEGLVLFRKLELISTHC